MDFQHTLRDTFVADHFHDLPGFVEARHGHNWEVEATVAGDAEPPIGFPEALEAWVRTVDYTLLNDQPRLTGRNPTAEVLAQWLLEDLGAAGLAPLRIRIREKAHYWAACEPAR